MGLLGIPESADLTGIRKTMSRLMSEAQRRAKPDRCILCGKPTKGLCDSHSVPKMILRNIAENGKVLHPNALVGIEVLDIEKGVKNSGTFHFICRECDRKYFRDYENPQNMLSKPTDRIMAEIALKDVLIQLYKRTVERELYSLLQERYGCYRNFDLLERVHCLDIKEYIAEVESHKAIIDSYESHSFKIMFWQLLPYKVPIAAQAVFSLAEDREGRVVNDVSDMSESVRMENMHVGVFPLKEATAVIAFHHLEDEKYKSTERQFEAAVDDDNLRYLNWLIFKYSENYFISKSLSPLIESDVGLKRLSQESNGFPNLGMVSPLDLLCGYTPVDISEVPCLLDEQYAMG